MTPTIQDMERFVEWLADNEGFAGASVLFARYENLDGSNLQGHFKQCFFAAKRFLREHPHLIPMLAGKLNSLAEDEVYAMDESNVLDPWLEHVAEHADDEGDYFSYRTLTGILPPSMGGDRKGGGGGISTLKRMLPLVARYEEESEA